MKNERPVDVVPICVFAEKSLNKLKVKQSPFAVILKTDGIKKRSHFINGFVRK